MAYADVSLASTSVSNPVFGAATNQYFGSWVSGSGNNDQSARNSESATAALGNAASQTQAGGQGAPATLAPSGTIGGVPMPVLYLIGGGFLLLVAAILFKK